MYPKKVYFKYVNGYKIENGVDLEGANLEEALADWLTTWPTGFDPKAAGVIFD